MRISVRTTRQFFWAQSDWHFQQLPLIQITNRETNHDFKSNHRVPGHGRLYCSFEGRK